MTRQQKKVHDWVYIELHDHFIGMHQKESIPGELNKIQSCMVQTITVVLFTRLCHEVSNGIYD